MFLSIRTTSETFQQSGKQDSSKHTLKISATTYESSGSQFFKTTTWIQSGPVTSDKSRLFMTILTILGVTEILCSFRLVCEGKTNKRISESSRLKFLEKFLGNNFALSDAKGNTAGLIDKGGIVDVPLFRRLLTICQKSWEPSFWGVMYSFVLLACASLAISRNHLQELLACLNLTLDSGNLFCSYKWKKLFLWTIAATQAAENYGVAGLDLIFIMRDIYSQKKISINTNHSYYQHSSP